MRAGKDVRHPEEPRLRSQTVTTYRPSVPLIDSRRLKSQAVNADSASRTALMRSVLGAGTSPRSIRAILSSADRLSSRNSIRSSKFTVFCASFIPSTLLSSKVTSGGQRRLCAAGSASTTNPERVRTPFLQPHFPCVAFNAHKGYLKLCNYIYFLESPDAAG